MKSLRPSFLATLLLLVTGLFSLAALAAGGGHDIHEIPQKLIWLQVLNFGVFVALLVYLLRTKVKGYFASRKEDFTAALRKAEQAKEQAESQRRLIKERLQKLESTASETIERARREAEELRANILREAEELSTKIREEAERATKYEVERAKEELRQEILRSAVNSAREVISSNIGGSDQERLNIEFVDKIQVVTQ